MLYLKGKYKPIIIYGFTTFLSILFSLISFAMMIPFLDSIFYPNKRIYSLSHFSFSQEYLQNACRYVSTLLIQQYGPYASLTVICLVILISIFLKNLFLYISMRVLVPMKSEVYRKFRADMYDKVLQLSIGYFTNQRKGDLMSRFSNDMGEIENSIMSTLEGLITYPLTIICTLVALIYLNAYLSLFLLVFIPITGFVIGRVSRKLKQYGKQNMTLFGENLSILEETLSGIRIIKAFNAEKIIGNKFHKTNEGLKKVKISIANKTVLASPLTELLGVAVVLSILWVGGRLVLASNGEGAFNAPALIGYIIFFYQIINPAKALSSVFYNIRRGESALKRVQEVLETPITVTNPTHPIAIQSFEHAIEFKNVSFVYPHTDIYALKNVSFTITKGKMIAIVGSSGAGKSTIADLIPRFHDTSEGDILIDHINIKQYSTESIRNLMGMVTQEPILFNDTIINNIKLSNAEATNNEVIEAAQIANAYNFIMQKEQQFETNIGERGNKLSGGEKQRLTIARAVLRNPPILILDEATSSLDTESERSVQDAINNVMNNRTSVVIAHRLSTIRRADEILVLQAGEIIERGTHNELYQAGGFYKKLVEMQEVH